MIPLRRSPEPAVLSKNKSNWTANFLKECTQDSKKRPQSSQYAHADIRRELARMSHEKCFYCEQKLAKSQYGEIKGEVDHYNSIHDDPCLAFEWSNLYLSCKACNNAKKGHTDIALRDCLNPCDPAVEPNQHLQFDDQEIRPKNNSPTGRNTIGKFDLARDDLTYVRLNALKGFLKTFNQIQSDMIKQHRFEMNAQEKELLQSFGCEEHAFSLMFRGYLEKIGL